MHIWPPFSTYTSKYPRPKVLRGNGIWLELEDGTKMLDAISSWWVCVHGHGHPRISKAIAEQSEKLEQVIFSAFSHQPAELLCERLSSKLPENLNTFFFSDNGSTAVEVALKMCIQYWENLGEKRTKVLAFEGAYHGDTFGAMSVGEPSVFNESFRDFLFHVDFLPYPHIMENESTSTVEERCLLGLKKALENHNEIACVIVEPLIQGAGGMRMADPTFFNRLLALCQERGIPVIFDEIMTGFGRTGTLFAMDQLESSPDFVCLSKGLTGGALPMSLTVCSDIITKAFTEDFADKMFYHGHSFTANPLGCAASLASLEIFDEMKSDYPENMKAFQRFTFEEFAHPNIKNLRNTGFVTAFEVISEENDSYLNSVSDRIKKSYPKFGILIRPLGNTVYVMPPYCISPEESKWLSEQLIKLLDEIAR